MRPRRWEDGALNGASDNLPEIARDRRQTGSPQLGQGRLFFGPFAAQIKNQRAFRRVPGTVDSPIDIAAGTSSERCARRVLATRSFVSGQLLRP